MSDLQFFGISSPAASELFTLMVAKYKDALAQKIEPWAAMLSGITSTAELRQKFPIDLTTLDGFREFVGGRDHKDGEIASFFIDSKPWERTIDVPLDVLGSSAFAPYINKVPNLVRAASMQGNKLIAALLAGGKTATCWDGKDFFAADHPIDTRGIVTGTWQNVYTGKSFSSANFAFAKKAFRQLKAPDGKTSLGLQLTHVFGGTDMDETFDALFLKEIIATAGGDAAETNIYLRAAIPVTMPEYDGKDPEGTWYALALNTDARPFEQQWKGGGSPEIRIFGDGSEFAAEHNKMSFQGKLFGNAGYAIPHAIIRFEP